MCGRAGPFTAEVGELQGDRGICDRFYTRRLFSNWDEICIISESTVADTRHPSRSNELTITY